MPDKTDHDRRQQGQGQGSSAKDPKQGSAGQKPGQMSQDHSKSGQHGSGGMKDDPKNKGGQR